LEREGGEKEKRKRGRQTEGREASSAQAWHTKLTRPKARGKEEVVRRRGSGEGDQKEGGEKRRR